jgi:hypothetical protein
MRLVLVVFLLLTATAAAADYVLPKGGLEVGGGGFQTGQLLGRGLTVKVGSDGRTLRLNGVVGSRCGDKAILRTFSGKAKLDGDSRFAVTLATKPPVDTYYFRGSGKAKISGTFDDDQAFGTIALTGARVQAGNQRIACNDDPGAFDTRDPSGTKGTGTPAAGSALFGLTKQHQPLVASVSPAKRLIVTAPLTLQHCRYAYKRFFFDSDALHVSGKGSFAATQRRTTRYSNSTVRYSINTSGHFTKGGGVTGRIKMDVKVAFKRSSSVRCKNAVNTTFAAIR